MLSSKPMRPRKCRAKGCGIVFIPRASFQAAHDIPCAMAIAAAKREQAEARARREHRTAEKVERDRTKAAREQLKTMPQLKEEVQKAFNAFIRARDAGQPCICCGRPLGGGSVGGDVDAGHYRSVGSAPHLRFDERNCHAQSKQCNRYGAGRAVDYRLGLLKRIGQAAVEELEADQAPRKYSRDELRALRSHYREKLRELERPT